MSTNEGEMPARIKAWKITPPGSSGFDAYYTDDMETWRGVTGQVEYSLEQQMEGGDRERDSFDQIKVTVEGVYLTEEEYAEIFDND